MSLVLDASVALKLVLNEEGADRARELAASDEPLIAPDFLTLEASNVLSVMVRRALLLPEDAEVSLNLLGAAPIRLVRSQTYYGDAYRLAIRLKRSAYDCLYLAVAITENATLVTADRRFAEAVQREPAYASAIRLL